MEQGMKIAEKLYHQYSYLAKKYAGKIYSYEELSFEYEDLVQEFRIKIFTSIKAYGKRWGKYRRGEAARPVPIRYYLEAACSNKARDFMKYISRENCKMRIDDISYDYGVEDDTQIIPERNKFVINGIDLLEGLTGKERAVFSLFLRGYNNKILNKVYLSKKGENEKLDTKAGVSSIIEEQKRYLVTKYGNELLKQKRIYSSWNFDEE